MCLCVLCVVDCVMLHGVLVCVLFVFVCLCVFKVCLFVLCMIYRVMLYGVLCVCCVRLKCVCVFCCDVWFDVVWSGVIVRVFAPVCVIVMWLCELSVKYYAMLYALVGVVLLLCCCVCDVCSCVLWFVCGLL